jgi:hypothetical protein
MMVANSIAFRYVLSLVKGGAPRGRFVAAAILVVVVELFRRFRQQQRISDVSKTEATAHHSHQAAASTPSNPLSSHDLAKVASAFQEILLGHCNSPACKQLLERTVKGMTWWRNRREHFEKLVECLASAPKTDLSYVPLEQIEPRQIRSKAVAVVREFESTLLSLSNQEDQTREMVQRFARGHILWTAQKERVDLINALLMRVAKAPSPSDSQLKSRAPTSISQSLQKPKDANKVPPRLSIASPTLKQIKTRPAHHSQLTEAFQQTLLWRCERPCPLVVSLLERTVKGMAWWHSRKEQFALLIEHLASTPKTGLSHVQLEQIEPKLRSKAVAVVQEFESTLLSLSNQEDEAREMVQRFAQGHILWNTQAEQVLEFNKALIKVARKVEQGAHSLSPRDHM